MCQPRNLEQWRTLFSSPDVRLKPFLPDGTYVFPWEKDYLSFPALVDSKTLPDLSLSTVIMAGGNRDSVECNVGQRLAGRLDVRDGYGRNRHDGLDEVRIWMVDIENNKRRAVGQVTDLRNGSYGLEITCLWSGSVATLRVAVSYPRELVRATIQQVIRGATRYTAGLFKSKDGVEEVDKPTFYRRVF
ncbi:hypothetical protein ElyMa_004824100 [Elysia marginata]|uniref:Uncharacterized protein n=1 Tax=Elysia marginata TaxID=1093978 RepID=A0AAV4IMQ5_9GAST|nr:hypothetical protein ElyMa_004824100 [Elysia marginata]